MAVVEARFYSWDDPNGTPIGTLTEEHAQIEIRHSFRGMGSGRIRISRSRPEATVALFGMGHTGVSGPRLVKVHYPWLPAPYDTDPVFAFWLWDGDFELLNHKGDDQLTFFGPGVRGILYDYIPGNASTVSTQPSRGEGDHPDLWWWIGEAYGAIATRLWEEGRHNPGHLGPAAGSTFEHVTIDFDRVLDSDNQPWAVIADEYEFRIGNSVGEVWDDLQKAGDFIVIGRPDLSFSAYSSYGDDLTGAAYGAGVVRVTPDNILTELNRHADLQQQRTHLLVRLNEGSYFTRTHPDYVAGSPERWAFRENPNTNDQPFRIKQIDASFDEYDRQQNALKLELKVGNTPGSGLYLPWVHYKPGDTITVDNGTEEYDYQDEDALITAISVVLDEKAADDSTDERAYRSIHVVLELNSESREEGGREQPTGRSGCTCPPLCKASGSVTFSDLGDLGAVCSSDGANYLAEVVTGPRAERVGLATLQSAGVGQAIVVIAGSHLYALETGLGVWDDAGNIYTRVAEHHTALGGVEPQVSIWYTNVTAPLAAGQHIYFEVDVGSSLLAGLEAGSKCLSARLFDGTINSGAESGTNGGISASPSVTVGSGELIVAAGDENGGASGFPDVITEDSDWEAFTGAASGASGNDAAQIWGGYRLADADGEAYNATIDQSRDWAMVGATFDVATASFGEVPNPLADDGQGNMNPDGCSCVAPGCHQHEHGQPAGSGPHHTAGQVTITDTAGDFTATDVEGALAELQSDAETDAAALAAHEAEPHGAGGIGPLLLSSDHAVPIVFDDILQASDGSDFLYASES